MNSTSNPSLARLARLAPLVNQDPGNMLLLAEASEAALAAGDADSAQRYLEAGLQRDAANPAWRFKLANLWISQRRLRDARELLEALQAERPAHPSVSHNLAYIEFLQGNFAQAAQILEPWLIKKRASGAEAGAIQALWLRALHHAERLDEAWLWVEGQLCEGGLCDAAAGVASLIAVDHDRLIDAGRLSTLALQSDPGHIEALIARGCILMDSGETQAARAALEVATRNAPHQARAWSTLGFVHMLEMDAGQARDRFEKALGLTSEDAGTWQGLGWACIWLNDLESATRAFLRAVELDPVSGESHGGLSVVLALKGHTEEARSHLEQAQSLQRGSVSARYAKGILSGNLEGLAGVHRVAQQILGTLRTKRASWRRGNEVRPD